jgi:glutamyl-tRNA synthetase
MAERQAPERELDANVRARLHAAMPGLKARAKTLVELVENAEFLFADGPRAPDAKAALVLSPDARRRLARLVDALAESTWETTALEGAVRAFADKEGAKLGDVAQPLRVALTGRTTSPPVFDVLAVLGRQEALTRIRAHAD